MKTILLGWCFHYKSHLRRQAQNESKATTTPLLDHIPALQLTLWKLSTLLPMGRTRTEKANFSESIRSIKFPESDDALDGDGTLPTSFSLHSSSSITPFKKKLITCIAICRPRIVIVPFISKTRPKVLKVLRVGDRTIPGWWRLNNRYVENVRFLLMLFDES